VILNQLGGSRHEAKLRAVIEHYTDVAVLGAIHRNQDLEIVERHLGLMPSNEDNQATNKILNISKQIEEQVDLEKIISISQTPSTPEVLVAKQPSSSAITKNQPVERKKTVKIAILKDQAFGFYYPGDMEALQDAGAELVAVNSLKDQSLPENIDGIFIGGGFPELHLRELSANHSFKKHLSELIEQGMPTYAECGGLMYLCRSIAWQDQKENMVGLIDADVMMSNKPQGRGLIKFCETEQMLWPKIKNKIPSVPKQPPTEEISAHEFHYSSLYNVSDKIKFAYTITRGTGIDGQNDGIIYKNLLASYAHLQNTQQNLWAERFVEFIRTTLSTE